MAAPPIEMSSKVYETLKIVQKGVIRTIIFNRPTRGNAWNFKALAEIPDAINDAAQDKNTVVGVITGAGDFYSSGLDITFDKVDDVPKDWPRTLVKNLMASYVNFPKPLVSIVNGPAVGGGLTTLALCDFVYCSDKAIFKAPFTTLGFCAEGCSSYTFPRIMGTAKASEILLLAKTLNAFEADKLGLITQVFPHDKLQEEAWKRIDELASLPPQSLIASKKLIRGNVQEDMLRANAAECECLCERIDSEECHEAVRKSFEKMKKKA